MKQGDTKVFEDKQNLYCALNLRRIGWSYSSIAAVFGCDRTSVEHQCTKYGITPAVEQVYSIESIAARAMPQEPRSRWAIVDGERINLGRSYQDYFESRKKPSAWVSITIVP